MSKKKPGAPSATIALNKKAKHEYHIEERFEVGSHIIPLTAASTHVIADPTRTRKLLLHAKEIAKIVGKVNQAGHTCIPLAMYWKKNKVKCEIALVKGKKLFDKRATEKERDWNRQKQRILRETNV